MDERIQGIKERTDLLGLAEGQTRLRRVGNVAGRGSEYAGPCPRCGGRDRFHLQAEAGRWFCRKCHPEWGDAIEYVRWLSGVGFREACARLEGGLPKVGAATARVRRDDVERIAAGDGPGVVWRARAGEFVAYAHEELWRNPKAMAYVRSRGLTEETAWAAGLGYNPRTVYDAGERWGQGSVRQWLPSGLVIPCWMGGELWYVKVRRDEPEARERYVCVRGSRKRGVLYGVDGLGEVGDVIICEGELNALTLRQELGDVCGVVSVGDAGNVPGAEALGYLVEVPRWWVVMDCDEAGRRGVERLRGVSERVRVLEWPWDGLDVNDALVAGMDLEGWVAGEEGWGREVMLTGGGFGVE